MECADEVENLKHLKILEIEKKKRGEKQKPQIFLK